ncbi:MAG TPA: carbohydrate ABC transporter permease [Luteimicrobium sp.]|nr:carbohydrate ABC transporter permease [Luteimicrobium sp.]
MSQLGATLDVAVGPGAAGTPQPPVTRRRRQPVLLWVAEHVVLVTLAVLFVAPVVFVFLTSVMNNDQALTSSFWPEHWAWSNYAHVFQVAPLAAWFGNSALYAVLATVFMLVSSIPAAYALAKIEFRGSGLLFMAIIVAMLLPPQVVSIPQYVMWTKLHLTGTLWPLILPNLLGDAFSIFLLRQFFLTIPNEYTEAARIDGAGELRVIWKVVLPMAKSGIAATAMFLFFHSWNDYYGPLLYTSEADPEHWPVALGMATFKGAHSVDWSTTMALTMLVMVPVVVLFFFAQRAFVEGVTLTGVKG